MSARPHGSWDLGPAAGTLRLRTDVEGKAARFGHRLLMEAREWSGRAVSGPDGLSVSVRAAVPSLVVVSGEGGAKPLSDKDKDTIVATAVELLAGGDITFASVGVEDRGATLELTGLLTVAGVERPVLWRVATAAAGTGGGTRLTGVLPVVQSAHGVTPYSTMLGALRVKDAVQVEVDVLLATPGT